MLAVGEQETQVVGEILHSQHEDRPEGVDGRAGALEACHLQGRPVELSHYGWISEYVVDEVCLAVKGSQCPVAVNHLSQNPVAVDNLPQQGPGQIGRCGAVEERKLRGQHSVRSRHCFNILSIYFTIAMLLSFFRSVTALDL